MLARFFHTLSLVDAEELEEEELPGVEPVELSVEPDDVQLQSGLPIGVNVIGNGTAQPSVLLITTSNVFGAAQSSWPVMP